MELDICDAIDVYYVSNAEEWEPDAKQRRFNKRRRDIYALFCGQLGVDKTYLHDPILNYYEFFKEKCMTNLFYYQRYNECAREFRDEEIRYDHGLFYHSDWFKEKFYIGQPYRDFEDAAEYIQKDLEQIASINAKHPAVQQLKLLILDAKYSWHYQFHTSLYILGTAEFIEAIQPAIEKYKYYVDKYYSKDI